MLIHFILGVRNKQVSGVGCQEKVGVRCRVSGVRIMKELKPLRVEC